MLEAQPMEDRKSIDQWRFAIIAGFAVGGITVSAWGPRLPAIIKGLDVGTGTIGLLMACATIGSLIGLVSAGPLLHRLGSRRSIATTLYVVAAGIALLGVSVMLGLMSVVAVAFAMTGAGVGSMDIMINVEGAAIEAATGRTQMPLMHGAWSGGQP
ncbi:MULTISPECIES: MFS transporter [Arthrobacter]|uniref:Major facilitator superfamily (MFS) profile domain-containing protein n=1 Tax=Arthrobacter terricola TaxID=2547396 RepID=A0A4R5KAU8_9MICC|nr:MULTISPECIES: MFS transporter [Arthrobacter]MBT8162263.1 hypothetical protein [Arthrobacter sp. GN70]TDF92261.1 hypothetical protein E1809_18630 [Arthrobacter terricola]